MHNVQKVPTSGQSERAFLMQNTPHQGAAEPVILGPAFRTWGSLEKLHDKPGSLPDPDTFAVDNGTTVMMKQSTASQMKQSNSPLNLISCKSVVWVIWEAGSKTLIYDAGLVVPRSLNNSVMHVALQ